MDVQVCAKKKKKKKKREREKLFYEIATIKIKTRVHKT